MIARRNLALLGFGALSLLAGLSGALVLLGIGLPRAAAHLAAAHGFLMAFGFLGTMIALERAVALGRPWGYLAPLLCGVSALLLVLGLSTTLAAGAMLAAGIVLCAMYVAFDRIEIALHSRTQAAGAVAWLVATILWLAGQPVSAIAPWLAAYLVLIIAGERLELSRLGHLAPWARISFTVAVGVFIGGVTLSLLAADVGLRVAGVGLLATTAWFARHDIARRTVRMGGITRFIALCLLIGYGWLAVGGLAWLAFDASVAGPASDAALHAIFLGFVMSMVFGHAPVIIPAVLRVPLPYHGRFYAHLTLLQLGLVLRIGGGDLLGMQGLWQAGGVLNVIALLLFVGSSAAAAVGGLVARRRTPPEANLGVGRIGPERSISNVQ